MGEFYPCIFKNPHPFSIHVQRFHRSFANFDISLMCFFQWEMGQADKWMGTEWEYILDSQLHCTLALITQNVDFSEHTLLKKMKLISRLLKEASKTQSMSVWPISSTVSTMIPTNIDVMPWEKLILYLSFAIQIHIHIWTTLTMKGTDKVVDKMDRSWSECHIKYVQESLKFNCMQSSKKIRHRNYKARMST